MLTFAVVASRSGRRLPPPVLDRLETAAAAQVPFPPDESTTWLNDTGTVWFAGWQPPGVDDREAGWHTDADGGLTAVAGRVWPRTDGWSSTAPVAAQLAHRLRTHPLTTSADTLAGVFIAASLHRHGPSTLAADPLGLGLLYHGRTDHIVVLSTRAAVAAALLTAHTATPPRRDTFGTGWLAFTGYPIGLRTGYQDVSLVPAGALVQIAPGGTVEVRRPPEPVWRAGSDTLAADPRAALDQVRAEITTALRTARRDPGVSCRVGLTGGKDSRLILALLLADGSAGDVTYQTFGGDDLADVEIARTLTADLGLRHVTNPDIADRMRWRRRVMQATRTDQTWRELTFRMTAATTSGTRSVHDPVAGRLAPPDTVVLSGLGGEMLRTNHPGSAALGSKAQAARFALRFGTAGIVEGDALDRYRREVHEILFDGMRPRDGPGDVVDAFYISQRQRRWVGSTLEVDHEQRVFPLYSMTGIRLAFGLGAENRHGEWIHRRLMRDAHERLLHLPFADDAWPAPAGSELVEPSVHDDPLPVRPEQPPPRRSRSSAPRKRSFVQDVRARQLGADVEIMRRMFEPDAANPAFELLDPCGLARAVDRFDDLPDPERQQLYGALTAVIWLGGHERAAPRELATG